MPSEDTKILVFNQNQKSDKAPFVIHGGLVCIKEKIDRCKNNHETSSTWKLSEHIPWFKKQFTCLEENTEKYITFTVPIEKEVTRIDKNGEEIAKNLSYTLQLIDSARIMARSLSNLIMIFLKEFIELNVNSDTMMKNVKHVELNASTVTVFLNIKTLEMV